VPIKWNKITWYSKLFAIILFVAVFYIGYNLGEKKVDTTPKDEIQKQTVKNTAPIRISIKDIKEENFSGKMPTIVGNSVLASSARAYIKEQISLFRAEANTDVPEMRKKFGTDSPVATYTIEINAKYFKSKKTESILMTMYTYTGGANGNDSYKVINTSLADGKILAFLDVIKQDEQSVFTEFVKKELYAWRPLGSDGSPVFSDEVKNLEFSSFENWSLNDNNLIIYFDKYSIGPGALGAVEFPLPLNKISNFIDSNFL
jgi:hypothetical protein